MTQDSSINTGVELLPVTQEDRDAAADYGAAIGVPCANVRRGEADDSLIVQMLARHRIGTRPTTTGGDELARAGDGIGFTDSVERVIEVIRDQLMSTDYPVSDYERAFAEAILTALHCSPSADHSAEVAHLREQLADTGMLAHKWMEAHDKLKAGKPYHFPSPADLPEALAAEARLKEALEKLIAACDAGRMVTKPGCGAGGMSIDANIRASVYNGVSAWAVEEARTALGGGQ